MSLRAWRPPLLTARSLARSHLRIRRDFVQSNYKELKTANPTFPFLVRECEGAEAKVWARYGKTDVPWRTAGPGLEKRTHRDVSVRVRERATDWLTHARTFSLSPLLCVPSFQTLVWRSPSRWRAWTRARSRSRCSSSSRKSKLIQSCNHWLPFS